MRLNFFAASIILLLLLPAGGFYAPALAQRRDGDSETASISGQVTIEGKPAPSVIVTVTRAGDSRGAGTRADMTDAEGRFNVTGLAPGEYTITPRTYLFVSPNRDPYMRYGKKVFIGAGETVDGVSLELVRGGVVTGRVTDGYGNPVAGCYVSLGTPRGEGTAYIEYLDSLPPGVGETDDRGVYRIFGVPEGRYLIQARSISGLGRDSLSYSVFYPSARDQSKAKLIEVSAGAEKTDIDITIVPLENAYTVSGRLIDAASGKPAPYVYIGHQALDNGSNRDVYPNFHDGKITDEEGNFRIVGLSSGRYRLFISTISDRNTEWYSDDFIVDVAGEDLSGIELKAYSGASVSGVVAIEGANDRRMTMIPGHLRVTAYSTDSENLSGRVVTGSVGADGGFRLQGLRPGAFRLSAEANGTRGNSLSMERVEVAGHPVSDFIELKAGQNISNVRIVMTYGDGIARGQIKFQNGEPPRDACFFVSTHRNGGCSSCYSGFQSRVTAGGQYKLEGLPPGEYELTLSASSCGPGGQFQLAPVKQTIQVANGMEARADFIVDLNYRNQ